MKLKDLCGSERPWGSGWRVIEDVTGCVRPGVNVPSTQSSSSLIFFLHDQKIFCMPNKKAARFMKEKDENFLVSLLEFL